MQMLNFRWGSWLRPLGPLFWGFIGAIGRHKSTIVVVTVVGVNCSANFNYFLGAHKSSKFLIYFLFFLCSSLRLQFATRSCQKAFSYYYFPFVSPFCIRSLSVAQRGTPLRLPGPTCHAPTPSAQQCSLTISFAAPQSRQHKPNKWQPKERERKVENGSMKSCRQTEATKVLFIDIKDSIMPNIWQLPDLAAKLIRRAIWEKRSKCEDGIRLDVTLHSQREMKYIYSLENSIAYENIIRCKLNDLKRSLKGERERERNIHKSIKHR